MSIISAVTFVEGGHAVVYMKTDDNEVHALEFGHHLTAAQIYDNHDKTHKEHDKHAQTHAKGHEHHAEGTADAAKFHFWSPITTAPTPLVAPTEGWKAVDKVNLTQFSHDLKADFHAHHAVPHYSDAAAFASFVIADRLHAH